MHGDKGKAVGHRPSLSRHAKASALSICSTVASPTKFSQSGLKYPSTKLVLTRENVDSLVKLVDTSQLAPVLPDVSPFVEQDARRGQGGEDQDDADAADADADAAAPVERVYKTCALVGNGGTARAAKFGQSIDKHDVVMRINQGPIAGYEEYVGNKTTFRLLNKKWTYM